MEKAHDKQFFYKYVTSNTAIRIISDLQVRWSSPLLFNDPFDTQMELRQGFEAGNLELLMWEEIENKVRGRKELRGDPKNPFFKLFSAMRTGELEDRFSDIKAAARSEVVDEESKDITASFHSLGGELNNDWKQQLHRMRIFCVTEVFDDLLMWAHYAENHTGVVIQFKCLPAQDTTLCIAKPVTYSADIPVLITPEELVDYLCGASRFTSGDYSRKQAFTKSLHWSYEREWRVLDFEPNPNAQGLFRTQGLWPDEIEAVFLGCRMKDEVREEIRSHLKGVLHHVKIYHASPSRSLFRLEFEQIR